MNEKSRAKASKDKGIHLSTCLSSTEVHKSWACTEVLCLIKGNSNTYWSTLRLGKGRPKSSPDYPLLLLMFFLLIGEPILAHKVHNSFYQSLHIQLLSNTEIKWPSLPSVLNGQMPKHFTWTMFKYKGYTYFSNRYEVMLSYFV